MVWGIVGLVGISGLGFGQNLEETASKLPADRYFANEQFYKAVQLYQQAYQSDSTNLYAAYQLAASYRGIFQYKNAMRYYKIVYEADSAFQFPLAVYYYALMLKFNENFKEAITYFDQFLNYPEHIKNFRIEKYQTYEKQAEIEKNGCYFALTQLSRRTKNYDFNHLALPVNSTYNDYAPAIYQHDSLIVITSSRITSRSKIDNRFGESFDDNFRFEKKEDGWKKAYNEDDFEIINTKWPDGSGCFNKEKSKYYYTSCDDKNGWCSVYVTYLKKGKWQTPVRLNKNVNYPKAHSKQPAITASGDTLFYVTDRPGGKGQNDIWMSTATGTDDWGPAINLGNKINTPFSEISPFYYQEQNILFFSSDGLEGFGALDVYMVKGDFKHNDPENLGWPFNTSRDDCYFTFGNQKGYLASNRNDAKTDFDIFTFQKDSAQLLTAYFDEGKGENEAEVVVVNSSEHSKFNGLINVNAAHIEVPITDFSLSYPVRQENLRTGAARFILSSNVENGTNTVEESEFENKEMRNLLPEINILSRKDLLLTLKDSVNIPQPPGALATISTFNIDTTRKAVINSKLMYFNSEEPVTKQIIQLADMNGEILKVTTTDEQGVFRFANIEPNARYKIMLDTLETHDSYEKYYLKDLEVVNYAREISTVKFENIYFDNGRYALRNEAILVLDDLITFYRQNPTIQIEINAYTDGEGGDAYNLQLSGNRGNAAFNYLIDKGLDRTALVINAKGKEAPVASNDNPIGKQMNRRVEFDIIGQRITHQPKVVTLFLKHDISLLTLAKNTGMSTEDLEKLNNFEATNLQAYAPVRVWKDIDLIDKSIFAEVDDKDTKPVINQTN